MRDRRYWQKLQPLYGLTVRRTGELARRDAVITLEMPGQRALIVEPRQRRCLGDRRALAQPSASGVQADLGQAGMWRQPDRPVEQANQLEGREPDRAGEFLEAQLL